MGSAEGQPYRPLSAGGLAVENCLKKKRVQTRTTVLDALLTKPAAIAERAAEVLTAGFFSVVFFPPLPLGLTGRHSRNHCGCEKSGTADLAAPRNSLQVYIPVPTATVRAPTSTCRNAHPTAYRHHHPHIVRLDLPTQMPVRRLMRHPRYVVPVEVMIPKPPY